MCVVSDQDRSICTVHNSRLRVPRSCSAIVLRARGPLVLQTRAPRSCSALVPTPLPTPLPTAHARRPSLSLSLCHTAVPMPAPPPMALLCDFYYLHNTEYNFSLLLTICLDFCTLDIFLRSASTSPTPTATYLSYVGTAAPSSLVPWTASVLGLLL